MGMSPIPRADSKALNWLNNFAAHLSESPSAYGVSPSEAAAVAAAVGQFALAHRANDPGVSNPILRTDKNQARISAQEICLVYYHAIKNSPAITDADKIAIGVRPVNRTRQRRQCPATSPALNVIAATPGAHTLVYKDTMSPDRRAKPFGATSLHLFCAIGEGFEMDATKARFVGAFTRTPMWVSHGPKDDGKRATYFGRWASARGDVGPWSSPISFRIAA